MNAVALITRGWISSGGGSEELVLVEAPLQVRIGEPTVTVCFGESGIVVAGGTTGTEMICDEGPAGEDVVMVGNESPSVIVE